MTGRVVSGTDERSRRVWSGIVLAAFLGALGVLTWTWTNLRDSSAAFADPGELDNLFHDPDHADVRRRLKGVLLDAMAEAEDRTEPQTRRW